MVTTCYQIGTIGPGHGAHGSSAGAYGSSAGVSGDQGADRAPGREPEAQHRHRQAEDEGGGQDGGRADHGAEAGVGGAGRALSVGVDVAHVAQPVADGPGRCRVLVPLVGGTSRHRRSLAASRPVVPEPLYDSAGLRVSRRATIPGPRPRARPPGCPRRSTRRRRSRPPPRAASSRSRTSRRW